LHATVAIYTGISTVMRHAI